MIILREKKDTATRYTTIKLFWRNFVGNLQPQKGPKTDFQSKVNAYNTSSAKFTAKSILVKHTSNKGKVTISLVTMINYHIAVTKTLQ